MHCFWRCSPQRARCCSPCSADSPVAAAGRATRVAGASAEAWADSAAALEAEDSAAVDSAGVAEDSAAAAPPEAGRRDVMKFLRLIRHLATTRWSTRRHFTPQVRDAIEGAIGRCEAHHAGEIRF